MSKQLALAISLSVLATVSLALFAVDPAVGVASAAQTSSLMQAEAVALPALSQLLPNLQ